MVTVDSSTVSVDDTEEYIVVSLNRPEKLNAINNEMLQGLHDLWANFAADPSKAVVLTGAGENTCAGIDTSIFENDAVDLHEVVEKEQELFYNIRTYPRPTVMACNGATVGGGLVLALESDFVVLGEDATLSYPEVQHGLFSNLAPQLLEHLFGAQFAKEVVLMGEPIEPERADAIGLASDVVPEEAVEERAIELTERLAGYDAEGVSWIKELVEFDFPPEAHRMSPP
jgi:enoyl-CoA hydratase/carnithine racemase